MYNQCVSHMDSQYYDSVRFGLIRIRNLQSESFRVLNFLEIIPPKFLFTIIWAIVGSRICYWRIFENRFCLKAHEMPVSHTNRMFLEFFCKDILQALCDPRCAGPPQVSSTWYSFVSDLAWDLERECCLSYHTWTALQEFNLLSTHTVERLFLLLLFLYQTA